MPNRNIHLTDHFDRFVDDQVQSGAYKDASEVLRAGLRLLEQQSISDAQKLEMLKKLTDEGLTSLDAVQASPLSGFNEIADAITKIGLRAAD